MEELLGLCVTELGMTQCPGKRAIYHIGEKIEELLGLSVTEFTHCGNQGTLLFGNLYWFFFDMAPEDTDKISEIIGHNDMKVSKVIELSGPCESGFYKVILSGSNCEDIYLLCNDEMFFKDFPKNQETAIEKPKNI